MREIDTQWTFNGVTSNLCIFFDQVTQRTDAVLATIWHRGTKPRPPLPKTCGNGFNSDFLPFAKGHIVALELGGSNNPLNIVPQFEHWQGKPNGQWRAMEIDLADPFFANHTMLVELGYGRVGVEETHEAACAAFADNPLRDWTDPRIPDRFRIRVWRPGALQANNLTTDADFVDAVGRLTRLPTDYERNLRLNSGVPQPDYQMQVTQMGLGIIRQWHRAQSAIPDFRAFLLHRDTLPAAKHALSALPGVQPMDAALVTHFDLMRADTDPMSESHFWTTYNRMAQALGANIVGRDPVGIPPPKRGRDDDPDEDEGRPTKKQRRDQS